MFEGRISKKDYFRGMYFLTILWILIGFISSALVTLVEYFIGLRIDFFLIPNIFLIGFVILGNSLSTRRAHDIGLTFWEAATMPFFVFKPGQKEKNKYGDPPKDNLSLRDLFKFKWRLVAKLRIPDAINK
jgi:uncharacterized membrane protein YhaH (DUF805 family)